MSELNIEKFSPKKKELQALSTKYQSLNIAGVEDKAGYAIVDSARKDLKAKRIEIQKTGKVLRADALIFQKNVIALEKELVAIVEPLERSLKEKQDHIDLLKLKEKRKELLPEKINKLKAINIEGIEEDLLNMSEQEFNEFYNDEHSKFLEVKARIIKKKEAEEAEKQKIAEIKRNKEEAERERIIKEEEDVKNKKRYIEFLKKNGCTKENKSDFLPVTEGNKIILYKKIDTYIK